MRRILPRQTWHQRQAWVVLAVYAALTLLDFLLTTTLATGRMGLTPAPATAPAGHAYEANPIAVWLFVHEGTGAVLLGKALGVCLGALLLLISHPMWGRHTWVPVVTLALLWAAVGWTALGVCSGLVVLIGTYGT